MKPSVLLGPASNGQGVFAARALAAGEFVLTFAGPSLTLTDAEAAGLSAHCLQVSPGVVIYADPPGRFVNHACDPNAGLKDAVTLVALRPIAAGEEVRFDYSTCVGEADWSLDCACGSALCRRTVRAFQRLDESTKEKYLRLGAAPAWLLEAEL